MAAESSFYRRKLPHWQPAGAPLFITWRLAGSLPNSYHAPGVVQSFVQVDRCLDAAANGPVWLKDPKVAQLVADSLRFGETQLQLYELRAWVLMPNHVHIVVLPDAPLRRITKAIKNFTALRANRILNRQGQPFWQHESFDHWVRNRDELERVVRYVETNPVSANLVLKAEDWPWSSASDR